MLAMCAGAGRLCPSGAVVCVLGRREWNTEFDVVRLDYVLDFVGVRFCDCLCVLWLCVLDAR